MNSDHAASASVSHGADGMPAADVADGSMAHVSMAHADMPQRGDQAPATDHRSDCVHALMAGTCVGCAVVSLNTVIAVVASADQPARAFPEPPTRASLSDVAPDVPPPRV